MTLSADSVNCWSLVPFMIPSFLVLIVNWWHSKSVSSRGILGLSAASPDTYFPPSFIPLSSFLYPNISCSFSIIMSTLSILILSFILGVQLSQSPLLVSVSPHRCVYIQTWCARFTVTFYALFFILTVNIVLTCKPVDILRKNAQSLFRLDLCPSLLHLSFNKVSIWPALFINEFVKK